MYRAGAWDRVPATALEDAARGELVNLNPRSAEFFACWLGSEERAVLAEAARDAW